MGRWRALWRPWGCGQSNHWAPTVFHYRNASSLALPRQPVPSLAQTMNQYLRSLEPLVNPKDLEQTRQLVAAFEAPGGEGERLQVRLKCRAARMENWVRDWWIQTAYLENHLPLVVHSSPAVVLPKQDFNDWRGQLRGLIDFDIDGLFDPSFKPAILSVQNVDFAAFQINLQVASTTR